MFLVTKEKEKKWNVGSTRLYVGGDFFLYGKIVIFDNTKFGIIDLSVF